MLTIVSSKQPSPRQQQQPRHFYINSPVLFRNRKRRSGVVELRRFSFSGESLHRESFINSGFQGL